MMPDPKPNLRQAAHADLTQINAVIEAAVMTWNLPERVKRLSLSSYRYDDHDFAHMTLFVAESIDGVINGVIALEELDSSECPQGKRGLLVHGIYVSPDRHHQGLGQQLIQTAWDFVQTQSKDGLLVKAQADAVGFFQKLNFARLPVVDAARDYGNRFWKER